MSVFLIHDRNYDFMICFTPYYIIYIPPQYTIACNSSLSQHHKKRFKVGTWTFWLDLILFICVTRGTTPRSRLYVCGSEVINSMCEGLSTDHNCGFNMRNPTYWQSIDHFLLNDQGSSLNNVTNLCKRLSVSRNRWRHPNMFCLQPKDPQLTEKTKEIRKYSHLRR